MTVFEKIIARELPADVVYETNEVLVFHDITPVAPVHCLVIPKKCIPRVAEAAGEDTLLLGKCLEAAAEAAKILGIEESGYRLVINNGADAGEAVPHLHIHLLGSRKLTWPPG